VRGRGEGYIEEDKKTMKKRKRWEEDARKLLMNL